MPSFLSRRILLSLPSPQYHLIRPLSTTPPPIEEQSLSVVDLLSSHGFSQPQITSLITARPSLLRSHPDRTLRPKLLLLAAAAGPAHLPFIVSTNPSILHRSLDNHLKPTLDLLHTFSTSPNDLLLALRRNRWLLTCNFRLTLLPNLTLLLARSVPLPNISKLLAAHPNSLLQPAPHFADSVAISERLGMKPQLSLFIHAVRAMSSMRPKTRDAKLDLFRKWGWSEEDIGAAFRRAPLFVLVSDEKLRRSVDFLVNTVGLGQGDLSLQPKLLMYSLEKRIKPRFKVFRALEAKGLLVRKGSGDGKVVLWLFTCSEMVFLDRYVTRYSKEVPELMDVYRGETRGDELNSLDR